MKYLLLCAALLTGCASMNEDSGRVEVLVQKDYVVRTAPDSLKTLPPLPQTIPNPAFASNNQVATWISNTEEYVANLEAMIQTLVNFYEKPVTTNEAGDMRVLTPLSPATPNSNRVIQPQAAPTPAAVPSPAQSAPQGFSDPRSRLQ